MTIPADAVDAGWLTGLLRRSGALPRGAVVAIERRSNAAFNSSVSHLHMTYSVDAPLDAPARLLLKRSRQESWAIEAGAREVAFYRLVAALGDDLPMIVPCHAAEVDARTGASVVLLADLSGTHHVALGRHQHLALGDNAPPDGVCDRVVEMLARFHAFWWEHPRLGLEGLPLGRWYGNEADWDRYMRRRANAWEALIAAEGDWFPVGTRRLYEWVLARVPSLWDRYLASRLAIFDKVTLTHGDAYFANVLYPHEPGTGQVYLIDWQSPEVYLGASDLANLIATFWTPAQRQAEGREARLLGRYHDTLVTNGVTGYAWDDLLNDYRLALIEWLLVPLQDRADGARRDYWWPKMRCLAGAFHDHGCADLLAG